MNKLLCIIFLLTLTPTALAEKTDLKLSGQQGVHYFFTVSAPWSSNPVYIENVFRSFCSDKRVCITHIWQSNEASPKKLPLSDKEVSSELATFQSNKNTGRSELLWNCKRFKGKNLNNCF